MYLKRSFQFFMLACLLLAGCALLPGCIAPSQEPVSGNITIATPAETPRDQATALSLEAVTWELVSYDSGRIAYESVIPGSTISARFEKEGIVHGFSGCNQYFATYESAHQKILASTPRRTQKSCQAPAGVEFQEKAYLTDLERVNAFSIDGEILRLTDGAGKTILIFRRGLEPPGTTGIAWKTWYLSSYAVDSDTMRRPPDDMVMTARFLEGTMSGFSGCNCYQAPYQDDGGAIRVQEPIVSDIRCRNGTVTEVEESFFGDLQDVAAYIATPDSLQMVNATGRSLLVFDSNRGT